MSEYQAWCLGAKVGEKQPSEPQAWQQVHGAGMILYPDDPKKRRAFEDLCVISRVVPLSSTPESATEVPITASHCTMANRAAPSHSAGESR